MADSASERRPAAQEESQRQHGRDAEQAKQQVGRAPAEDRETLVQEWRPDRAREIVAAGGDRHRDPTPTHEPMGHVGHERAERRRAAEHSDQQRLRQHELDIGLRRGRDRVADREHRGPEHQRHADAEAVGEPSHAHSAQGEADHRRRVGDGGAATVEAELGLDHRQGHDGRPQADAADGRDGERHREPAPSIGAVRQVSRVDVHFGLPWGPGGPWSS